MVKSRWPLLLLGSPLLALACADGGESTDPTIDGADAARTVNDQSPGDADAGPHNPYLSYDSGASSEKDSGRLPPNDAATAQDSARAVDASSAQDSSMTIDGGVTIDGSVTDSASPESGSAGDDCVGTTSSLLAIPYTQACDNYFWNTLGASNPCTASGNECTALNGGGTTFCCFQPRANSHCFQDYGGAPQCVPK
jgi:hypothetical protein